MLVVLSAPSQWDGLKGVIVKELDFSSSGLFVLDGRPEIHLLMDNRRCQWKHLWRNISSAHTVVRPLSTPEQEWLGVRVCVCARDTLRVAYGFHYLR